MRHRALALALFVSCLPACSAIVSPDPGRLGGGSDAGTARVDGGSDPCMGGCDDSVPCTTDRCTPGGCEHLPDDSRCEAGQRCSAAAGCVDARCSSDGECDDAVPCTVDRCEAGACVNTPDDGACASGFCTTGGRCQAGVGCVSGTPRDCSDGNACTSDHCDEGASMCVYLDVDADSDGFSASSVGGDRCGGPDCDDSLADVYPGAPEACGNGRDDDCDERVDEGCTADLPDTCASAERLDFGGGSSVTRMVDLRSFRDDYDTSCGADGGADAVFYFEVTRLSDIVIETMGSTDTVLGVGFSCDDLTPVCNDDRDPDADTTSRVFLHRFGPPPGMSSVRVYVVVDSYSGSAAGPTTLRVTTSAARADTCSEPMDITGGGTLIGIASPVGGATGNRGSCQSFEARFASEAVFRVGAPADRNIDVIWAVSADFTPDLYMRRAPCSMGEEIACTRGSTSGGSRTAQIMDVDVRSDSNSYLFVDGVLGVGTTGAAIYVMQYNP